MSAPVRQSVALVDCLNAAFTLRLADAAEARAWLRDGGWAEFDAWVTAHRHDLDGEETEPETSVLADAEPERTAT